MIYIPAVVALNVYTRWLYIEMVIDCCLFSQGILNGFIYADFWSKIRRFLNPNANRRGSSSSSTPRTSKTKNSSSQTSGDGRDNFEDPSASFMVEAPAGQEVNSA